MLYKLDARHRSHSARRGAGYSRRRNGRFCKSSPRNSPQADAPAQLSSRSATRSSRFSPSRARRRKNSTRCGAVSKVASNAARLPFEHVRLTLSFRSAPKFSPASTRSSASEITGWACPLTRRNRARTYCLEKQRRRPRRDLGPHRPEKARGVEGLEAPTRFSQRRRSRREPRPQGRGHHPIRVAAGFKQWRMGRRRKWAPCDSARRLSDFGAQTRRSSSKR